MAKRCKTITYSTCPPTGTCQACKEIVRAECIKYYGDPLDCIEIESGDNLENILEKINTRVCESPSGNYNEIVGTATLVGGTVTVNTSFVTSGSIIQVSCINPSGTQGILSTPSASIVNGVSFVINSSEAADTSLVMYRITKN
jgi:hypothetical protein